MIVLLRLQTQGSRMTDLIQSLAHIARRRQHSTSLTVLRNVVQVWENYEPVDETATMSGADEDMNGHASSNSPRETVSVTVTEVVSGSEFYVQVCTPGNPSIKYLNSQWFVSHCVITCLRDMYGKCLKSSNVWCQTSRLHTNCQA